MLFVLKRGDEFVRYLGGRLVNGKDELPSGYFIVLGVLWTKDLQGSNVFHSEFVSYNEDTRSFLANVREKYGSNIEIIKIKYSIIKEEQLDG